MIEVYTKKNKRCMTFKTEDVRVAVKKLRQLNIINIVKYLIVISYGKLCTYFCSDCHKRSYFDYPNNHDTDDAVCNCCKQSNKLFFVGFKQSRTQTRAKYAV